MPMFHLDKMALGLFLMPIFTGQAALLEHFGLFGEVQQLYAIGLIALVVYMFSPQVAWAIREGLYRWNYRPTGQGEDE